MTLYKLKQGMPKILDTTISPAKESLYINIKELNHDAVRLYMILADIKRDIIKKTLPWEYVFTDYLDDINELNQELLNKTRHSDYQDEYATSIIHWIMKTIDEVKRHDYNLNQLNNVLTTYNQLVSEKTSASHQLAAKTQLIGLEQTLLHWENLYNINVESTYVIIVVSRGPKANLIEGQLFKNWLAKRQGSLTNTDKKGIIYTEMLPDQMNQELAVIHPMLLNDLAAYLLNREIGKNMLDNEEAMDQDVLGKQGKWIILLLNLLSTSEQGKWILSLLNLSSTQDSTKLQKSSIESESKCPLSQVKSAMGLT